MIRKTITVAAITAVAVALLLTFSNTAYSSPIGDEVFIEVIGGSFTESALVTVDNDLPEFTVVIPLDEFNFGPSGLTIDIGVDHNGDGTIWLTYEQNGNLVPSHVIVISDINWIDPNTNEQISGFITGLQCNLGSDIIVAETFDGDIIQLFVQGEFEPIDIHCTFFAEHDEPTTDPIREPVRDNVDIENIKLKNGQFRVIVDNAGIGGTSDVEITWVFKSDKCVLYAAGDIGGPLIGVIPLVDDGALSVPNLPLPLALPVAHNDVNFAEAIILGVNGDAKDCKIDSKKGEYVSVSTIGMGGPGPLDTSNPTGP